MIEVKSTKTVTTNGIKALVYGMSGAGKTTLAGTLDRPLVLSAESGLLALAGKDIDFIEIGSIDDLRSAYDFVMKSDYKHVVLDSISEIAEVVLSEAKKASKDPRQAYGAMADQVTDLIRAFRDIPGRDVIFIAKAEKATDEAGRMLYSPSMPGQKVGQNMAYFFDLVLALRVEKNEENEIVRALLCNTDGLWSAKDRSGKLDLWERPNLKSIFAKIKGESK